MQPEIPPRPPVPPVATDAPMPTGDSDPNHAAILQPCPKTVPDLSALDPWSALSARLRGLCKDAKLNINDLADRAEVSRKTVANYIEVRKRSRPSRKVRGQLIDALRYQYQQVLMRRSENENEHLTPEQIKQCKDKWEQSLKDLEADFERVIQEYDSRLRKKRLVGQLSEDAITFMPVLTSESERATSGNAQHVPVELPSEPSPYPLSERTTEPLATATAEVAGAVHHDHDLRESTHQAMAPARQPATVQRPLFAQHQVGRHRRISRISLIPMMSLIVAVRVALTLMTIMVTTWFVTTHTIPLPAATHRMEAAATTYRAAIPGLGCDHGGADWKNGTATQMVCLNDWGVVTGATPGQTFAQELFHLPGGTLRLQRLRVDVEIGQLAHDACGGLQYQMDVTTAYHYAVAVCQDGSVVVLLLDTAGQNMIQVSLPAARVVPASVYHLTLTIAKGIQTVVVNGQPIPLTTNAVAGACDFISLATSTNAGGVVHAAFANFAVSGF